MCQGPSRAGGGSRHRTAPTGSSGRGGTRSWHRPACRRVDARLHLALPWRWRAWLHLVAREHAGVGVRCRQDVQLDLVGRAPVVQQHATCGRRAGAQHVVSTCCCNPARRAKRAQPCTLVTRHDRACLCRRCLGLSKSTLSCECRCPQTTGRCAAATPGQASRPWPSPCDDGGGRADTAARLIGQPEQRRLACEEERTAQDPTRALTPTRRAPPQGPAARSARSQSRGSTGPAGLPGSWGR